MNMVFCKVCGRWIAETATWINAEPDYCEDCKPPSFIKRMFNKFWCFIRSIFTKHSKTI